MKTASNRQQATAGNTIVVTLTTLAIVGGFVGMAATLTNSVGRNVQRSLAMRQAMNIGDAAMETAFGGWRALCIINSAVLAPTGSLFAGSAVPTPSPGNFPTVKNYTLSNFSVKAADPNWNPIEDANATPSPVYGRNVQSFSHYYIAAADVTVPTLTSTSSNQNDRGNVTVHVKRIFEKRRTTLGADMFGSYGTVLRAGGDPNNRGDWNAMDLEIHPGPVMEVTGNVHTNGNLYTGHDTLKLYGNTSYAGTWAIGFKPGENQHNGETPTSPVWGTRPVHQDQAKVPFGVDASSYRRLVEPIPSPPPGPTPIPDPIDPYRFSTKTTTVSGTTYGAGVQIYIDDAGVPTIKNANGSTITSSSSGANGVLYNVIKSALAVSSNKVSQSTLNDVREGATTGNSQVRVTNLNVARITEAITTGEITMSNPVIYILDTSADSNGVSAKRGIRLQNGASLPTNGLTFATGNPIYVQGDYNTGRTTGNEPPSNNSTPNSNQPTVSGYDRKPAAIIADAINLLSNNWNDTNLQGNLTTRNASNTTVNAAFVSGIVESVGGYYSGGAENFPRFLENWTNKTVTYYGSMNQMFASQQAIGRWGAGNVYNAPKRAWYVDPNFLTQPPPGMPYTVDYVRSRWYTE